MIHIKDHKTPDMFDPFPFLGPKRKQRIESSWEKIFREHILPMLPVEKVFSKYDPVMGAPTKELYAMLGLMVIQQMHDLTDEEAVDQFAYNLQWHYALNITSTADAERLCQSQNPLDHAECLDRAEPVPGHFQRRYQETCRGLFR